ncbi:uncharacterized protein EI90DRAFT_3131641 [Cantharellus anzutake]|uniref:uncharacterized protein n=1 Tax=Cantharellus anzutake TaxID=1750568 RepID=UPI001904B728|nr:uncharacterized protein EI90DRAFT_3131641 [Cantharellus anzutake]KAF8321396.1 hypothetical protein EI90DRAFT_3131641 [Cantharellus anzutake]
MSAFSLKYGSTLQTEFEYFYNLMDTLTDLNSEYLRILRRTYVPDPSSVRPRVIENYRRVMGRSLRHADHCFSLVDLPLEDTGYPEFYHATIKEFITGHPMDDEIDQMFFINDISLDPFGIFPLMMFPFRRACLTYTTTPPHWHMLGLSPGRSYIISYDKKRAFIWSTGSHLDSYDGTPRAYLLTGPIHSSRLALTEEAAPLQGSRVGRDLDQSWFEW